MRRAEKISENQSVTDNEEAKHRVLLCNRNDTIKLVEMVDPPFTISENASDKCEQSSDLPSRKLIAEAWVSALRRRNQAFPDGIFADPAWDILLDMYLSHCDHREVSVMNACVAANVPPTTALRWITVLEDKGLITRANDLRDSRRKLLSLTEDALAMVETALDGAAEGDRRLGLGRLRLVH